VTRLVRSELLKIRTTKTWWLFAIGAFVAAALAFLINAFAVAHSEIHGQNVGGENPPPPVNLDQLAVNVYTSGQFFGLMFVMLIGILVVTNEFYHQTATATFLAEPRRTKVIVSKLLAAIGFGVVYWLATTVLDVAFGSWYFSWEGVSNGLGHWPVTRGLLLNLLAYVLWAILGVGIGVLLRSQIGSTITATLMYTIGIYVVIGVLSLIHNFWIKQDWVLQIAVLWPSLASLHMISGLNIGEVPDPPRWLGAVVLIGYAVVAGVIGTMITRKRDVS
jgi:ABC-type transport system involved in multi-copper enzyme maturation permease subunit